MSILQTAHRKEIAALHRKKERMDRRLFLVEGLKSVDEAHRSAWRVKYLVATDEWAAPASLQAPVFRVRPEELQKLSALDHAQQVLAVVHMPEETQNFLPAGRVLALDALQDPGNLGTILRLADWFGLEAVVCSADCVDRFNPKTVQASMGSLFRVQLIRTDLPAWLAALPETLWTAGAFLEGGSLYRTSLPSPGVLVLGNEGQGIRPATAEVLRHRVTIPGHGGAESLNVATAAAVFASEWTRRDFCGAP